MSKLEARIENLRITMLACTIAVVSGIGVLVLVLYRG